MGGFHSNFFPEPTNVPNIGDAFTIRIRLDDPQHLQTPHLRNTDVKLEMLHHLGHIEVISKQDDQFCKFTYGLSRSGPFSDGSENTAIYSPPFDVYYSEGYRDSFPDAAKGRPFEQINR